MKKVFLIGDSIRLNYMPMVCRLMQDKAEITGPADNCRFAKYTLFYINEWIKLFGTPDIIHFNNGLWDVSRSDRTTGCLTSINEYTRDLSLTLKEMRKTGADIIFATSTPVRAGNPTFDNADIITYNSAALALMESEGIEINDLFSFVDGHTEEFIDEHDLTHLNKEGIKAVGSKVAEVISRHL